MRSVLTILVAYLLGSIPCGYLVVRVLAGADVRETGSGGTGATNVSRRAGKAAGVMTLALDALKGATAVAFACWIFGSSFFAQGGGVPALRQTQWWIASAAIAVIVGHIFPVWLGFRGGKGVATAVGVFLVLAPAAVAVAGVIFVSIVWRTRYVSLGSIVGAAAMPLAVWLQSKLIRPVEGLAPLITAAVAGALLIIVAHRANIRRLLNGSESKFK